MDFDENSLAALDLAVEFATSDGTSIIYLVHVVPPDEIHLLRSVYRPEEGGGANEEWAQRVAVEKLEEISRVRLGGIRHEVLVRVGHPAETVLDLEKELGVELVVMATHGRTGISHFVLGSVAEKVVRESSCPVLTVRKPRAADMKSDQGGNTQP